MAEDKEQDILVIDDEVFPRLLGVGDENLRYIESRIDVRLTVRDSRIIIRGTALERERAKKVFLDLQALLRQREDLSQSDIDTVLRLAGVNGKANGEATAAHDGIQLEVPRGQVTARSKHQERYLSAMERNAITFAIGPAGTGKTYLAVAMAVDRFHRRMVDRIILVRPMVETGETLGFLPGDILEKVDPYFRPLYDALGEMLSPERMRRFIERGYIEIAPLAYMRGRTLNNAFVILDEAQNTTSGQMKMFLTRLGASSRAVLTGDLTQVDLPDPSKSGLLEARELLTNIEGIAFIEFDASDVVRHRLVAEILLAYNAGKSPNE